MPALIPVAAVKPSVHKESAEADEPPKKNNKKAEEESKENNGNNIGPLKNCKKSKRHKKEKRKCQTDASVELDQDLIIPVSPGLAIDHAQEGEAAAAAEEDNEPVVKMETRGSKEAVNCPGMRPFRSSFWWNAQLWPESNVRSLSTTGGRQDNTEISRAPAAAATKDHQEQNGDFSAGTAIVAVAGRQFQKSFQRERTKRILQGHPSRRRNHPRNLSLLAFRVLTYNNWITS